MPAAPRILTGNLTDINAAAAAGVVITFERGGVVSQYGDVVLPNPTSVVTNASGAFSVTLYPGTYSAFARTQSGPARFNFSLAEDGSTDLADLLEEADIPVTAQIVLDTQAARDKAQEWATNPEDDAVETGQYSALHWAAKAADSAAAASTAGAIAGAAAGAAAAEPFADAAASSASAALVSQTTALAAANAAGPTRIYATKAAANSALSGLDADTVVEVSVDESRNSRRTRYRKTGGVYVFELDLTGKREIYLDSINGNDANSGLSPTAAVETPAAANTLLEDGDTLFVARNGTYYDADFSGKDHIKVRPFGSGRRPIFTAAKSIPAVSWSVYSGNIYKATVVHDNATVASTDPAFYCQFALWDDKRDSFLPARMCGLRRVLTGANYGTANVNLATDIAAMTAGSFTVRRTGADNSNPFSVSATSFDYYVWLADGADPSALTDRVIRYAEQVSTAAFGFGSDIEGVDFCRSANKDHVSGGTGSGSVGRVHDVRIIDASVHGSVMRCSTYTKYYAEKNPYATIGGAGNGLHLYREQSIDGVSRGAWCDEIEVVGFETGVHAHGNGSGTAAFDTWEMGSIKARDCGLAFFPNELECDMHVKSLHVSGGYGTQSIEGNRAISLASAVKLTVDDFSFKSQVGFNENISAVSAPSGGEVHIKNGWVDIDPGSTSGVKSVASGAGTVRLDNVTVINGPVFTTTFSNTTTLIATDCILGNIGYYNASQTITATNCQLYYQANTLAEIQALWSGVGNDCLVPFYAQPYSHTYDGTTITTESLGTATTTSGAAFFLASINGLEGVGNISIAGADGSGGALRLVGLARDAANDLGSGTQRWAYTATNVSSFPASVTAAAVTGPYSTRVYFPDNATLGTAKLYRGTFDGTGTVDDCISVTDPKYFTVGQLIRLGALPNRREPLGLFRVVSIHTGLAAGNVLRLDREVPWRQVDYGTGILPRTVTAAAGPLAPEVAIGFGFPIASQGGSPGIIGVSGTITYSVGGTVAFNERRAGATGQLNPATAQSGSDYVRVEEGIIPNKLRVASGDSVSMSARCFIEEWTPWFVNNPAHDRLPILDRRSPLAQAKMGWRRVDQSGGVEGIYT